MSFGEAVSACFARYVTFSGRAARPEYWYWVLFVFVAQIVCAIVDRLVFGGTVGVFEGLFSLATFLPSLAVHFRRLHDIDKSAWWILIAFVPLIGVIVLGCVDGIRGMHF